VKGASAAGRPPREVDKRSKLESRAKHAFMTAR